MLLPASLVRKLCTGWCVLCASVWHRDISILSGAGFEMMKENRAHGNTGVFVSPKHSSCAAEPEFYGARHRR